MFRYILNFNGVQVESYGFLLLVAVLLGLFIFWKKSKDEYYDEMEVLDMALQALVYAFVVGRVAYGIVNFGEFGFDGWKWIAVWKNPGLWWVGSVIGAAWAVWVNAKKRKWNLFKTYDLAVIGLSLFLAVENLAKFVSGVATGKVTSLPIGMEFVGSFEKRHPVGIYGFILWMLLLVYLWWIENKYRRFVWYQRSKGDAKPGFVLYLFCVVFGLAGIVLGLFSESGELVWGLNLDLLFRIIMMIIGVVGLYYRSGLKGNLDWVEVFKRGRIIKK